MTNGPNIAMATRERHPLVEMLAIAAPSVVTMSSYTAMQFVDAKMVSMIGPDPVYVAAQGNGGMTAWVPISILMGMLSVINTYVSQNLGAGKPERGSAYGWAAIWTAAIAAALIAPMVGLLPWLFGMSGRAATGLSVDQLAQMARQAQLEVDYASTLMYGAFFTIATRGLAQYFYGIHRPSVVMIAAIVGNLTNMAFNAVLIYGPTPPESLPLRGVAGSIATSLGIPALGVKGAAIATVIGTAVELLIPLAVFLGPTYNRLYKTRAAWRPSLGIFRDIIKIGWPGALMFGSEMICWWYFTVRLVGSFGTDHTFASWIALRYMHMSFMPAVGISFAVTAMVGKAIGMKRPDVARKRALLGMAVTMGYMGVCALAFVVFRHDLIEFFITHDPARPRSELEITRIIEIGSGIMIIAAVFQVFDAMGITMVGALRGAGDTVWPGVMTVVFSWGLIVGGGHVIVAVAPDLGAIGPWLGAAAYIIAFGSTLAWRFSRGKWREVKLLEQSAQPRLHVPVDTADGLLSEPG
ncbi:MAG: MATE family efflux transporter [Phycisphaerales bacterium]|nr:MATE family efflux transporter [Phycisphaerales bacterium]